MKISIIGNNLTSLILAKSLANKNVNTQIFHKKKTYNTKSNRCIAITNENLKFLDKNFVIPKNLINPVNEISILNEQNKNDEILNFKKKQNLIFLIKNNDLIKVLKKSLKKIKFREIKNSKFYENLLNKSKNELIINCENNNFYNKNFFNKKFYKDYKSVAYTFLLKHKKIQNHKATQIFTKYGPLAFLPLSNFQTSVVFSIYKNKKLINNYEIVKIVKKYNKLYSITGVSKVEKADLIFESARKYYYKNILLFGNNLHRIHPLAGQGFNMTLRDLKILVKEICKLKSLGLPINENFNKHFENKTKPYNLLYSNGINLIENIFRIDSVIKNKISNKIPILINKNQKLKNILMEFADKGFNLN